MTSPEDQLAQVTVRYYLDSGDFNGIPLSRLVGLIGDEEVLRAAARKLIGVGIITCVFSKVSINPHIKRLPDLPMEMQLELLETESTGAICCYPSPSLVENQVDTNAYNDRPFTKRLVRGAAQLEFESFDLTVLERYIADPRYRCDFGDYSGRISIRSSADTDKFFPDRDKIFLNNFGLGYCFDGRRVAVAFLRYLHQLSPEHQQSWNSYRVLDRVQILKDFYENTILGEPTRNVSYFKAIASEIALINELTKGIRGQALFLKDFGDQRPAGLSFFLIPTLRHFNEFILAMDKVLSENINRAFFQGTIPLEREIERSDGKIIIESKGTLALLEEWVRSEIQWENVDDAVRRIVLPLRRVRRLRQNPAHKFEENVYSREYEDSQHEILEQVYESLAQLRYTLSKHPRSPTIKIPEFLTEGRIVFY